MRAQKPPYTAEEATHEQRRPPVGTPAASRRAGGDITPAGVLALQRTAGNAAVTGMVKHRWHDPVGTDIGRGPQVTVTTVQRALPIQRMRWASGNFEFTNVSPDYMDKATRVLDLLSSHSIIKKYVNGRPCRITLEKRTADTPADVIDRGPDGVQVTMAAHYFENYEIGYIAGMLAHEFGIHPVPESRRGVTEEEAMFKDMDWPVPGLSGSTMNSATAKQGDHVLGVLPGSPRYQIYKDVALEMARLLLRDATSQAPEASPKDVTDLLDCFLMDVASVAATNDNRLAAASLFSGGAVRRNIATVYEHYKNEISTNLPEEYADLKPLFPPEKVPSAVTADFGRLAKSVASAMWGKPRSVDG
ncbi:hypothetical protein GCM10010464_31550 [Pseudonocardia yunnanensis]|uniref:Uncharacterized protein n=1 Tax=Pseudonocardia yunnanensis TaxID=58107 RepID=A0ABW4EP31_9PSEU